MWPCRFLPPLLALACAAGPQTPDDGAAGGPAGAAGGTSGGSNGGAAGRGETPDARPSDDGGQTGGQGGGAGGRGGGAGGRPASVGLRPPEGKTWLFIGQDVQTIDDYAATVAPPGGLVGYTSLQTLGGLDRAEDHGAGVNFMQSLVARHPRVPVAIGLYLVGALDAVNRGEMDGPIDALAVRLGGLGRPVLLRIGYEFDNPGNGYDATTYRAAFARIASRVRRLQPSGIDMVWQSAAICGVPTSGLANFYPGDDAVDWVGLSYFRQADCNYAPVKAVVEFARAKAKAVLIAEGAPQGYDLARGTYSNDGRSFTAKSANQAWNEWFVPMLAFVRENADVIRGVTYIDANWNAQPMWRAPYANGYFGDSRVQADPTILSNWRAALAEPLWATF